MASIKMSLILLATILMYVTPTINAQCAADGTPCQPDGSTNCCSEFCYKQEGWDIGYCRARTVPCEPDRTPCQPNGRTNCCTGFCYKQEGWTIGYCRAR
ncbi:uncharacterized protein LOC127288327 [Leptopilina boulardi]|uniref:uncharacterized protein LOC127288327 n=1 Tax=Leptopilina boulardi TaxID=63433 RepID=UPI0021F61820|nr:uncharacterized protein LOC127288327 [Leptopilina boulardi]